MPYVPGARWNGVGSTNATRPPVCVRVAVATSVHTSALVPLPTDVPPGAVTYTPSVPFVPPAVLALQSICRITMPVGSTTVTSNNAVTAAGGPARLRPPTNVDSSGD